MELLQIFESLITNKKVYAQKLRDQNITFPAT